MKTKSKIVLALVAAKLKGPVLWEYPMNAFRGGSRKVRLRMHGAAAQALVAGLVSLTAISSAAAQGANDWALTRLDRVVKLNSYATVTAEHFDGQGGWVEITIDGRA